MHGLKARVRAGLVELTVAALLAAAGCGNDDDAADGVVEADDAGGEVGSPEAGDRAGAAEMQDGVGGDGALSACDLLTPDDIEEVTGVEVTGPGQRDQGFETADPELDAASSGCVWDLETSAVDGCVTDKLDDLLTGTLRGCTVVWVRAAPIHGSEWFETNIDSLDGAGAIDGAIEGLGEQAFERSNVEEQTIYVLVGNDVAFVAQIAHKDFCGLRATITEIEPFSDECARANSEALAMTTDLAHRIAERL